MYDLVSDINQYKHFVPWCTDSKVIVNKNDILIAKLGVGFKAYSESYTSTVYLNRPNHIKVIF